MSGQLDALQDSSPGKYPPVSLYRRMSETQCRFGYRGEEKYTVTVDCASLVLFCFLF
jgi:hypothetical protein